jgi:hypothetical protein
MRVREEKITNIKIIVHITILKIPLNEIPTTVWLYKNNGQNETTGKVIRIKV